MSRDLMQDDPDIRRARRSKNMTWLTGLFICFTAVGAFMASAEIKKYMGVLETSLDDQKKLVKNSRVDFVELQEKLEQVETDYAGLQVEHESVINKIDDSRAEYAHQSLVNDDLSAELKKLRTDLAAIHAEMAENAEELAQAKQDNRTLLAKLTVANLGILNRNQPAWAWAEGAAVEAGLPSKSSMADSEPEQANIIAEMLNAKDPGFWTGRAHSIYETKTPRIPAYSMSGWLGSATALIYDKSGSQDNSGLISDLRKHPERFGIILPSQPDVPPGSDTERAWIDSFLKLLDATDEYAVDAYKGITDTDNPH